MLGTLARQGRSGALARFDYAQYALCEFDIRARACDAFTQRQDIEICVDHASGHAKGRVISSVAAAVSCVIGRDRALAVRPGDLLAVLSAGAYCMSMASNYNSRGRAAEILVDGHQARLIRNRESVIDQMRLETLAD